MAENNSVKKATITWLILICLTIASFTLVESFNIFVAAVVAAVVIAYIKDRLIFTNFMELKVGVRPPYRILFEVWAVLALVVILGGYCYGIIMR